MEIFASIAIFLLIFSAVILAHEFGHFFAARRGGFKVEEFGLGLPPRICGKKTARKIQLKNKTVKEKMLWSLNWIPFGGFVKVAGEEEKKKSTDPRHFQNRPVGAKIFFTAGGILANLIFGWFLFFIAFSLGAQPIIFSEKDLQTQIARGVVEVAPGLEIFEITENSAAQKAGLQIGDLIFRIDGAEISTVESLHEKMAVAGETISLEIFRGENREKLNLDFPAPENGKLGVLVSAFAAVEKINEIKLPPGSAAIFAARETGRIFATTFRTVGAVFGKIFRQFSVPKNVVGPVGIAQMTYNFWLSGDGKQILIFAAILSVSIGAVNLIPFPALDGGRLFFLILEFTTKLKLREKWENKIHALGFAFLLLLIFAVTFQDFARIF